MAPFRRPADLQIDSHSGYCSDNGTYYSKRATMNNDSRQQTRPLTSDLTTYIFSYAYKLEEEEEGGQRHFPSSQVQDALVDGNSGETITYSGLRQAVLLHKRQLHSLGVRKGSVVMIVSPNTFKLPPLFLAVFSLGAVLTLANPLSLQQDIQWQVALSKPTLILVTGALLSSMHFTPPVIPLEDLLNNTLNNTWNGEECAVVSMDDAAAIMYSSGTTGKSKGVVLTHGNFASTVAGNMARHSSTSDDSSKVCLLSIPLFFIYGLRFLLCSIAARATIVFHQSSSNMGSLLHCIARHRVTLFPTVPHVLAKLLSSGFLDLTSLKQIAVGGAPLRKEIIHAFRHKFPSIQLTQAYGLTETTGGIIYTSGNEENRRIGTVGLLSDVVEAKIVDCISGQFLPPNHRGELWLRGPTIMKGYVDHEAETLLIMNSDGWLKTGDLCYIDEEGFLFIVDRLKDMIKYKGYQIAPAELEELLLSHPEIVEASVIPYPDQEEGQIPMAYVVKDSASILDGEEVINFISKKVMPYKKLRRVVFLNSIPKNSNGKVLKRELVKRSYIQSRL